MGATAAAAQKKLRESMCVGASIEGLFSREIGLIDALIYSSIDPRGVRDAPGAEYRMRRLLTTPHPDTHVHTGFFLSFSNTYNHG